MQCQSSPTSRSRPSWFSTRVETVVIGSVDVFFGLFGLSSWLLLTAYDRHTILFPFDQNQPELNESSPNLDHVGESYQYLLEFWLPALFLVILGTTLILAAAANHCRILALLSFVLSTLFIAGCLATLTSLLISQKLSALSFIPLILVTVVQIYFYIVVGKFWMEVESRNRAPEDKELLVIKEINSFHV